MLAKENLTALFHDLVRAAMETQRVDASETSEFYLVQLLEAFARPARGNLLDPPLAIDYLEACNLPGHARYEKLREAFGGVGVRVTTPAQLREAMEQAIRSRKPTLINAAIDEGAGTESGRITNLNPMARKK